MDEEDNCSEDTISALLENTDIPVPSVKKATKIRRGYYSEILTGAPSDEEEIELGGDADIIRQYEEGALDRINMTWEKYVPGHCLILGRFPDPRYHCFLHPAKRWIYYPTDRSITFPVDTFKPRLRKKHYSMPLQMTRSIEIERLRRLYLSKSVKKCLDQAGVHDSDLLPLDILKREYPGEKYGVYSGINFLKLEWFDNDKFDYRTPQGWLNTGITEGQRFPIPADAYIPSMRKKRRITSLDDINLFAWTMVAVTGFDPETFLFTVCTLDGQRTTYQIPRIHVMFKAEDPRNFAKRLRYAVERRTVHEQQIRLELYVDFMVTLEISEINEDFLARIVFSSTRNGKIKNYEQSSIDQLITHVKIAYKRTMCDIILHHYIKKYPQAYSFVKVPPVPHKAVRTTGMVPLWVGEPDNTEYYLGASEVLAEIYSTPKEYFRWYSVYVLNEVYWAIFSVSFECIVVGKMMMFQISNNKEMPLEEFEGAQSQAMHNIFTYLKTTWIRNIIMKLKMHFGHTEKGWYCFKVKNPLFYDYYKLKRIMILIKQRMQGALRDLVLHSIHAFIDFVETPCQCLDEEVLDESFVWGQNLIYSKYKSPTQLIFSVILQIDEDGVGYSTPPEKFLESITNIFENAMLGAHEIGEIKPILLTFLKYPPDMQLSSVGLLEASVVALKERLTNSYEKMIILLWAYAREFQQYIELYNLDVQEYVDNFSKLSRPSTEVKEEISFHFKMAWELEEKLPSNILIGPFNVIVSNLKQFLLGKRQELYTKLLEMYCTRMKINVEYLIDEYRDIIMRLREKPQSIEHIFEIKDWMETIPMTLKQFEEMSRRYMLEYELLDYFWFALPQEDFENKWEAMGWPHKIRGQIENTVITLMEETAKFYTMQLSDEAVLEDRIEYFTVMVTNLSGLRDASKVHDNAVEVRRLWKNMKEAQEMGFLLNQRQKLFQVPVVPFDNLNKLIKEFEPHKHLWGTASDWLRLHDIWMDNPLVNIDVDSIDRTVNDMYKLMVKSIRTFADIPLVQGVAIEIRNHIDDFRPRIPLIQAIRSPGMRDRHWIQFKRETDINIVWSATLTFNHCLDLGIEKYSDILIKTADNAAKEYAIEVVLCKMEKEWDNNMLELQAYKESGTFIVKIPEEIIQMLDDHVAMTQQLSFSPFKGVFEDRIIEWEEQLKLTTSVIEEWIELQKQWMYLEPIFSSEDISSQLPTESKKYKAMERTWRRVMRNAHENPSIIEYCADRKLLESLRDCRHLLEIVEKGLAEYLETKRNAFPRLYFLSDDELLEILSQGKNPRAVQPHLRKCFENIAKLQFEDDLRITKMYSAEDECVTLNPDLYPTGSVESWLFTVELSMKNTVRTTFGDSMLDMPLKDRKDWVLCWPGQIVIAGCQTYWTAEVEKAILENKLKEFFVVLLENLDALRSLVKGSLTFLQREVLSALIVIEVHSRDVTQNLVDLSVINVNDFEWIKQLRYYWIEEQLKVRAVNAEFSYGYEYLGNSGRLVITPLTDRCYLTLTGALHLKFGGAPAGPAGTGKTETTKDLAKAFAIQCVVFNCSDQLDFMAMGKFFKGLASSGAWACFDEFNRIDIEVLSVVAQQITTIQKAQQARADRFIFEGVELTLKESCSVFITMNPGYAGRTELPDNLKALFRPVAMMVPNYSLIAEISLFSFGFSDAKQLAEKITTTFKLSSEQLSTQDHYDFGMRAVKTVIAVAGNLKREKPDMEERQIVLRALSDVNVPKFLKDDLKLFNGIVSDLFPRMEEEQVDYGILEDAIRFTCRVKGLEDVDDYITKVIQLYETTVVRHGLMLVGPTGSGKTKCYEILKDAMTSLQGKPTPGGYPFQRVFTFVLNPKSITMGQLYGEFDLSTHEWTDGILSSLVRMGAAATDKDKRWYVFDGPVDAVWIENMNTVLDDNKKLCLSSGEIIKLKESQTMMFEVADLAVASPATVSRCGMVYLEPGVLGLQPYLNCWVSRLPELAMSYGEKFQELFSIYLIPALEVLRSMLKEIVTSVDSALVQSFLNLMDYRLSPLRGKDNKPPPASQFLRLMPDLLVPWVVFSVIWSVGCSCDYGSRVIFSNWLREIMRVNEHLPLFPPNGLVYDYKLHDGGFTDATPDNEPTQPTWLTWMDSLEDFYIHPDMKYSDIEVPTIDSVRNAEMIGILLMNENNVICIGPTGAGKTLTVIGKLSRNMHKKFICDFITFSARTSANQTQDLIDSKLDRRRKGVFGPPMLKRQIFFIDDLNMPALEVYGAQPPIELVRQWMDFGGWYDRKQIGEFKTIIDVNFVAAMGPPGGGRNPVTARLLRHFHYLTFTEMEDSSKLKIFGTILRSWLERTPSLEKIHETMANATLSVYKTILKELLPTPAKTHYTFNLRDLSKVFQGLLMMEPEKIEDLRILLRLWYHENCRVYQDRLVTDGDRIWFDQLLRSKIRKDFNVNDEDYVGDGKILFADFMDPTSDVKYYTEILDINELSSMLQNYLDDYNTSNTKTMNLVLFLDAMSHITRISRVIRQPMGNALLLGMGGSGRQSLTQLAAHVSEYTLYQIELSKNYGQNEWKEDIKSFMLNSGLYNQESVFLFSDTQIKSESFLEDLNSVLNSGDVPNIYQSDEMDKIYQNMKTAVSELGMAPTKSNLFTTYQKQVRNNLHTVISMSPIGEIFRARLRQFPALVNCCTIDWFCPWPESALQSVAIHFLLEIEELEANPSLLKGVVITCQNMHASVVTASELYFQELSRHNYVTPTSYLELLSSYSQLMAKKKEELLLGISRLRSGLDKLLSTALEVKDLQIQLQGLKPALEIAMKDAEVMIGKIAADTIVAEETKMVVEKEEFEAAKKSLETQMIAEDAQADLDEAMPTLLAAEQSLKSLNKNDITEVRAMKHPPVGVIFVIEAICIVKNVKPIKVPGTKLGEKINDYWEPGRGMLSDPGLFLQSLMNFDKDSITDVMIKALDKYIIDPQFQPAKILTVSKACTSLCMWVHAIYKYYFVNQSVAPKKAKLQQANAELEETERALAKARAKMQEVLDGLDFLNVQLRQKIAFKEEKEDGIILCEERMSRAVRLTTGLADERVRWMETIQEIENSVVYVTGDILICSGAIAYLTPFTDRYRRDLLNKWTNILDEYKVPHSTPCEPVAILGEPVAIRKWQLDGLPRDTFSAENAVLVAHSKRWPLFIDPQGQANKWIRNGGKILDMVVCKQGDKDFIRTLESSIRFGKPVLIENVGTDLDPALDPLLRRQVFKQSGQIVLKLGDNIIPYHENFRLFLTTKLPNPHYTPEVSIKVLLVNFTLVSSGLQDQLLALVVMQERPDLEEARSALIVSNAMMRHELKELEDRILQKLSSSEGSPIDDVDLISTLEASKLKSSEIKIKVEAAEITQQEIDLTRAQYIPVANRGQLLFFCLADLSNIDPMYQYSLEWFINIFISSMANTQKSEVVAERIKTINDSFTYNLFTNVCRSLFEKHKMQFAFLMCARILMNADKINPHEWHYFLAGSTPTLLQPNPAPEWISLRSWNDILSLQGLKVFGLFVTTFEAYLEHYKNIFDSTSPHREPLPLPFEHQLNDFQKMIILKCLRPDKVTDAMQDFLTKNLGEKFIEPQTTELSSIFQESSPMTPLIFVLSTGTDPAADLYKFAEKMRFNKRMLVISLGQGQGPRAERMIYEGMDSGFWVFFQNCHLAPSFMPQLERLIENIPPETVHRDFRIWLTSTPSPHFPAAILQNGSKMTVEPPRGVKSNLLRAYTSQIQDMVEFFNSEEEKVPTFKWLLFSLCLFHGIILERRKFGPLGFNIPYEFTDGDLRICISQLYMFLMEYDEIPYKVLTYTAGHINYGGRVTDDWDRRCLMFLLHDFYNPQVINENHVFDEAGNYHQLSAEKSLLEYMDYIRKLPLNDEPGLFGLHMNADISSAQAETYYCLSTLLALQPKTVGGTAQSQEDVTTATANKILEQIPDPMNMEKVSTKYPVMYDESLNTVILQEVIRYNRLLKIIKSSLQDLLKALKGLVVMSETLENMALKLFSNVVPTIWSSKAYPSLKPLGAWVIDLNERVNFLNTWIDSGIPSVFWISGFYFPQAFLTGTLQNFARKYVVSIDTINFKFKVLSQRPQTRPVDGCYIDGLFLEGASWNKELDSLDESRPKELYTEMPVIWLCPEENHMKQTTNIYDCPVYKTLTRAGTLSTTGHSTNYVVTIELPTLKPENHWIKRGVATICALDY